MDIIHELWGTWMWHEVLRLEGHKDFVTSVAFSPDGRQAGSVGDDALIRWDLQ
jgi:WD40 repeat protein